MLPLIATDKLPFPVFYQLRIGSHEKFHFNFELRWSLIIFVKRRKKKLPEKLTKRVAKKYRKRVADSKTRNKINLYVAIMSYNVEYL